LTYRFKHQIQNPIAFENECNKILDSTAARYYVSSPAASPSVNWRAAEARYQSWQKLEKGHKHFFMHTRASLAIRFSLVELDVIVMGKIVMSIFWREDFLSHSRKKTNFD